MSLLLESNLEKAFRVSVKSFDFPGAQDESIRVALYLGDDRGATDDDPWEAKGKGFRTR